MDMNFKPRKDNSISNLFHCECPQTDSEFTPPSSASQLYVYGVQGKSKYTGVWTLESLLSSNANLKEVDPDRMAEKDNYILPDSLEEGLCNQLVFLGNSL